MTEVNDKVDPNKLTRATWIGKGAKSLGLQGEVRQADFESAFNPRRTLEA
jgi:hypothetical protein